jgi:seryl-tRNA synthetase
MLDIRYVAHHADEVAANCQRRGVAADVQGLVDAYLERNKTLVQLEALRAAANVVAQQTARLQMSSDAFLAAIPGVIDVLPDVELPPRPTERPWLVAFGKALKLAVPALEAAIKDLEAAVDEKARKLPNLTHPDVPSGKTDNDHNLLRTWGTSPTRDYPALDHLALADKWGWIDFEAGARVAGQKFYFLREELVLVDLALQRFALDRAIARGFRPVITPDLARPAILEGIGFAPRGPESQVYCIDGHDLCLVGTAEITIGGTLAGQILDANKLPLRIAGLSHCFRTEAGAAGRESKGLYRVHQFTKVELFVFCKGDLAASDAHHQELVAIEEELFQALEVPYRVLDIAAGELGAPAYRKFDLEAWLPGRGVWGEVTSTSNCTDFQARRLGIKERGDDGSKPRFVHTLNGTAMADSRTLIALLENHQQKDGSVAIPDALQPYLPFAQIPAWPR